MEFWKWFLGIGSRIQDNSYLMFFYINLYFTNWFFFKLDEKETIQEQEKILEPEQILTLNSKEFCVFTTGWLVGLFD